MDGTNSTRDVGASMDGTNSTRDVAASMDGTNSTRDVAAAMDGTNSTGDVPISVGRVTTRVTRRHQYTVHVALSAASGWIACMSLPPK